MADQVEQHIEHWNKLAGRVESGMSLVAKNLQVIRVEMSALKKDVSTLKQDVNQLVLNQTKLIETTSRIEGQQSQGMAILLKIIDRLP